MQSPWGFDLQVEVVFVVVAAVSFSVNQAELEPLMMQENHDTRINPRNPFFSGKFMMCST